jgi:hypothetical protein
MALSGQTDRVRVCPLLDGYLRRTNAFVSLGPTEKGMVSYFLGMTLCKLFASRLLSAPWLLHLDVFRPVLNPVTLGRSRPDLVGEDIAGNWHAFESKGRSSECHLRKFSCYFDSSAARSSAIILLQVGKCDSSTSKMRKKAFLFSAVIAVLL